MLTSSIVIPTLDGGDKFARLMNSLRQQTVPLCEKLVIDSGSTDKTVEVALKNGCRVIHIERKDFNHGATRRMGAEMVSQADIAVFMTQDAILLDQNSLRHIIQCFEDGGVGAAYGRQLPHGDAGPIGAHARLFNYPVISKVKAMEDADKLGIKTAFISNSFAAYRQIALQSVGSFPANTILSEDTYVAAKMLVAGWKIVYCAEAQVYHSHDYSSKEEFKRYFDIGVFHARESWLQQRFGQAEREGAKFVKSELDYLWNNGYALFIPSALLRTAMKLLGYRLGLQEKKLPEWMKVHLSMHRRYWL